VPHLVPPGSLIQDPTLISEPQPRSSKRRKPPQLPKDVQDLIPNLVGRTVQIVKEVAAENHPILSEGQLN